MAWTAKASDGHTHKYILNGVKDFDKLSDDTESFFVWLWSVKDYLKSYSESNPDSVEWIEKQATADPHLSVCADIANWAKHARKYGRHSRSGRFPKLGKLRYTVPMEAIGKITVRAFEVETNIAKPELVTFELPILDAEDRLIGDAFDFLDKGVARWERMLEAIELGNPTQANPKI